MRSASPDPATAAQGPGRAGPEGQASAAPDPAGRAAQGPIPEPLSAADNPLPAAGADSPAEAEGRRTLSTAFVRIGAGEHLTVELRDGRVLLLRDVVMRPKDYCGVRLLGAKAGGRYCGGYAEVAAARPGAAPAPAEPVPAVADPIGSPRSPSKGN
jgi:hypothetical protein